MATPAPKPSKNFNADGVLAATSGASALSPQPHQGLEYGYLGHLAQGAELAYRTDGIARKIVDLPVATALNKWIEADKALDAELKRLHVPKMMREAGQLDRLYGGALVFVYANDGGAGLELPLGTVRGVYSFCVASRFDVTIHQLDFQSDPSLPNFGEPEYYTVQVYHQGGLATQQRIHASRCFRLDGQYLPPKERYSNQGWGDSALSVVGKAVHDYGYMMGALPTLIKDFITTILALSGLADTVSIEGGEKQIQERVGVISQGRSLTGTIVIDGQDTYSKQASSVTGIGDLIDRSMMQVSATCGIPVSLLFGRGAQGMNATGDGDMNNWHESVSAYQEEKLSPLLNWVIGLIEQQTEWQGDKPESYEWQWPDLAPMDEQKRADIKLKNAQADQLYVAMGAVDAAYLYHQRHDGGEYKFDVDFTPEGYEEWLATYDGAVNSGTTPTDTPTETPEA